MGRCQAFVNDGEQCPNTALWRSEYCWQHMPGKWVKGLTLGTIVTIILAGIGLLADVGGIYSMVAGQRTPRPTPTPTAFSPATEDESLIIVADFDDRSGGKHEGIDPAQYVYERLVEQVRRGDLDIRIERLREVVDDNTARSVGEAYGATLVLWGWYDALSITPRMERIRSLPQFVSREEGQHLSMSDAAKIEFSLLTCF